MWKRINIGLVYTTLSALFILMGTLLVIQYAKGNFRLTRQGDFVRQSGLLSANSFPPGAEVYIDGRLVTATDDTLYLEPGTYDVEIVKEGYWPWKKTIKLEEELVTQTNAQLFPSAPSLTPLTFSGVQHVAPSPDGQKILYYTNSASSPEKNGLYILELTNSFLSLQRGSRQISDNPTRFDLATANFIWSPDSSQVMLLTQEREILLDTDKKYSLDALPDIGYKRRQLLSSWEEEMYIRERQFLKEFPEEVIAIATISAKNVYISPDKKRMLYTASTSASLPLDLVPPVPAPNSQPEIRTLQPSGVYIYDREEDRNFQIGTELTLPELSKKLLATDLYQRTALTLDASPSAFLSLQASSSAQTAANFNRYHTALYLNTFQWFPDSKHILYTKDNSIQVKGYDNTNDTTIYAGPYEKGFVYPWPDGSKVLFLASFNPDSPANLYAVDLK
jgi:hypothetical protein